MSNLFLKIPSDNKAKEDTDIIMEREGFTNVAWSLSSHNTIIRFICKFFSIIILFFRVKKGDILLVQYPFKKYYNLICNITHLKEGKVVTLIHDLGSFRRKKLTVEQEQTRLNHSDVIIVHNDTMKKFLKDNGMKKPLVSLGIFDYIAPTPSHTPIKGTDKEWQVVYAGGLAKRKSTFLYLLDKHISGWHLNIHGNGLDDKEAKEWKNITPRGFINSDDFIDHSIGHFGLVWDGTSINECTGAWGEYLRINNPHKTSFYIRSGKPVIMWEQAALTPFILKEGVGIAVNSLLDIEIALNKVSKDDYALMAEHARKISKRMEEGFYFLTAFSNAKKLL